MGWGPQSFNIRLLWLAGLALGAVAGGLTGWLLAG